MFKTMKFLSGITLALMIPVAGTVLTDAPVIWPVSTLIYNLGLLSCFALMPRKTASVIVFNVVAGSFFLVESAFFFSYYLQNTGFNDAFFYHLRPDLLHAGVSEHLPLLLLAIACLFGFLLFSSLSIVEGRFGNRRRLSIALTSLIFGIFISPPAKALVDYVGNLSADPPGNTAFDEFPELKNPELSVDFTATKRPNIVMIYAESLEQRFFDEAIFPGLMPNLKKLRKESVDFTNIAQGLGAGWTVAGMVASQCGYPLAESRGVSENNLSLFDKFLPKATCLGDLLEKDGFHLTFIGGADERFAGKGDFLKSHGYAEVLGRDELETILSDKSYLNPWGVFDDTLFEYAFDKFSSLSRNDSPFLLTLLTIDTHHPNGFLSKSCGTYAYDDNSMLNSVHCSDQLISNFIEKVRGSEYSANTLIILLSDHLALRNVASPLLKASTMPERLTFFINTPQGRQEDNNNPGLHYDIAPTILDFIGYKITGPSGFGSPLTRGSGYLPGKYGEGLWKKQSENLMAVGSKLWDNEMALDADGIKFTLADLTLALGGRKLKLRAGGFLDVPASALLIFNENTLALENIKAYPLEKDLQRETLGNELLQQKGKLVLVISTAKNLPGFSDPRIHPDRWVFYCGKPGSDYYSWGPITGDFLIPYDLLQKLGKSKIDDRVVNERQRLLQGIR